MRLTRICLAGLALLASLLLAACGSLPPPAASRDHLGDFVMEARFALRLDRPGQARQSGSGRLTWEHRAAGERILIATPLGYGLAEIATTPELAYLKSSDGKIISSPDADSLMETVTGERLPVARLPAWLLGRPGASGQLLLDHRQRPLQLIEAGWQLDYAYDDDAPATLPARISLRRGEEVELRLRVEEWRKLP